MPAYRIVLAFVAGILLYQAVVEVGGILSAVQVPKAYFDWFGRGNAGVALAVVQLIGFAIPIAALVAAGTLCIHRLLGGGTRVAAHAVLAGMLVCFTYWVVVGLQVQVILDGAVETYPWPARLRQLMLPPWWAVSGVLAPWLGFALAAWLTVRRRPV